MYSRNTRTLVLACLAAASSLLTVGSALATPYSDLVLADSPYVYYQFDNDSGTAGSLAEDASGNGRDGNYSGDTVLENDTPITFQVPSGPTTPVGLAPRFDGPPSSTGTFVAGTTFQPATFNAFTLELWAKSDTAVWNQSGALVSKRNAFIMHPDEGSTNMRFFVGNSSGGLQPAASFNLSGISGFSIQDWHHYVGTYDGTNIRLYVDGVLRDTESGSGTIAANALNTFIGRDSNSSGRLFDGLIDEVALYDQALSGAQILAHFEARNFIIPEPSSGLLTGLGCLGLASRRRRRRKAAL